MLKLKTWSMTAAATGTMMLATAAFAQQPAAAPDTPAATQTAPATAPQITPPPAANPGALQQAQVAGSTWQVKSLDVPEGTKVLLELRSSVNTRTARPGDGVYLSSSFPVVVNGQVAIPAGVYVQGVIDQVTRPGRVKGRAGVRMHFSSVIFPNGSVVNIPGVVNGLPGSGGPSVQQEGRIEQAGGKGKDAATVAGATATGAGLGTLGGAYGGSAGAGAGYGAMAGGAAGLLYTLFTRGDDVILGAGQSVEMVLQRPLTISQANLVGPDIAGQATIIPTAQQPLPKPRILCPVGGLGCS